MDILTQGLVGAAMAQTVASKQETRRAALTGFIAGLAADADVLIRSAQDPLLTIEYHRHFTHSIFFIPIGALIVTVILWPFMRKTTRLPRLFLFCLLGFSLSGVIDASTSYGTQLFWPLSDERIAWSIISIVDPVFTGMLLIGLLVTVIRQHKAAIGISAILCVTYLGIGVFQQHRVGQVAHQLAESRGHVIERQVVKPTFGNLVLWRSMYVSQGTIYVDGIRATGQVILYPGDSTAVLSKDQLDKMAQADSVLSADIMRFARFSDNYVGLLPGKDNAIGDMRYSLLPTSLAPLWGIEFDSSAPQQHARFVTYRALTDEIKESFMAMLAGSYPGGISKNE